MSGLLGFVYVDAVSVLGMDLVVCFWFLVLGLFCFDDLSVFFTIYSFALGLVFVVSTLGFWVVWFTCVYYRHLMFPGLLGLFGNLTWVVIVIYVCFSYLWI